MTKLHSLTLMCGLLTALGLVSACGADGPTGETRFGNGGACRMAPYLLCNGLLEPGNHRPEDPMSAFCTVSRGYGFVGETFWLADVADDAGVDLQLSYEAGRPTEIEVDCGNGDPYLARAEWRPDGQLERRRFPLVPYEDDPGLFEYLHDCRMGGSGCNSHVFHYDEEGRLFAREEFYGQLNPVTLDEEGRFTGERYMSASLGEEVELTITYDGDRVSGRDLRWGDGNSDLRVYQYDDQGRLLGWDRPEGATFMPPTWTWSDTGVTIQRSDSRVEVDLDELGRLREVRGFRPSDTQVSLMTWRWREDGLLDGFFFENWGG